MNNRPCDILFLYPVSDSNSGQGPCFTYTLGLGYICAFLQAEGIDATIFLSGATSLPLCLKEILSFKPKVVGIAVVDGNYAKSLLVARSLKQLNPSLILVLGGPTPTANHEYILENEPYIDICVRGEAEEIFYEMIRALSAADFHMEKADLSGIKGISYRSGKETRVNDPANILLNNKEIPNYLDRYPSPYLTGFLPATEAEYSGIVTARGCNQSCVYCNCSILYKRHVFTRSVDRVLEELDFVGKMSPKKSANIFDDAFTLYPKRAESICRGMIENGISLRLTCTTRCDSLSEDLLDLMKEAGFHTVSFSLESAVPRLLRMIGKNHPPEDVPSDELEKEVQFVANVKIMAAYAKKIGMKVHVSVMLGLPTETRAEASETIRYLKELPLDQYSHNLFGILAGTPISLDYEKYGYRLERLSKKQIRPRTIRPHDLSGIGLAYNSVHEEDFRRREIEQFQILGLLTKRAVRAPFFYNVILRSDVFREDIVRWLQDNLALGGTILQIFSGPERFREKKEASLKTLLDLGAPSTKLVCYCIDRTGNGDTEIWSSGENDYCAEIPIKVVGSKQALESYDTGNGPVGHVLAMDREREGAEAVTHLLQRFDDANSCFDHLVESRPYPLIATLCRWLRADANCKRLETALIDEENSIRLCWKGAVVGVIPDSAEEIFQNLKALRATVIKERGCADCAAKANCARCYFPAPMPVEDYCHFVKNHDVHGYAEIFRTYYVFKDLFGTMNFEDAQKRTS